MSDIEHQYVAETRRLRVELAAARATALRAIRSLIETQDAAEGTHEPWLDDAMLALADRV